MDKPVIVLVGRPNVGKSTLFNALVDGEAAIVTDIPGTTRDVLTKPVAIVGVPFLFVDTAGLREGGVDPIEAIGIAKARAETGSADLVLWLDDAEKAGFVGNCIALTPDTIWMSATAER